MDLRIGEVDSLSGVLAAQGTAVHEGVVYAVAEANGRGGIQGHRVKLITRDDGGRPDEATTVAQELATRERVSALVGGYVDSIVGPVISAFESFQTGTPDFIPLLARVKSSGGRLLLMDGFFADNLVLLRQVSGRPRRPLEGPSRPRGTPWPTHFGKRTSCFRSSA